MNKLLFITTLFWASCQNPSNRIEKPQIQLEKDTLQVGNVGIGDSVTIRLSVKNVGGGVLNITNIGYGCGCTEGAIERNTLDASELTYFKFTYKNEVDTDSIDKTIIFETNAVQPFKLLKIIGKGAPKVQTE